jgi:hypothetical protein
MLCTKTIWLLIFIHLDGVRIHESGWWEFFSGLNWFPVCSRAPSTYSVTADTLCKIAGFSGFARFAPYEWYVQHMATLLEVNLYLQTAMNVFTGLTS